MKKYIKKIAAFGAVVALSFVGLTACSSNNSADGGVLKVGMECAYAPFNWTQNDDSNGAVEIEGGSGYANGYDVQIAKRVAADLGKKLVVVKLEWDGLLPALTSKKIDLIVAGMSPTEERKASIDFSQDYYTSEIVMVVKKDGKFANAVTPDDFKDAKVTSQLSTIHYDLLDQLKGANIQPAMDDYATMITALAAGKIDGFSSEYPAARSAELSNPKLKVIKFSKGKGFKFNEGEAAIAIGVKKDNGDLLKEVNESLVNIVQADRDKFMEEALQNQPLSN